MYAVESGRVVYFILSNIVVSSLAVEGLLNGCVVVVLCVKILFNFCMQRI